jgi:hypothetical protein
MGLGHWIESCLLQINWGAWTENVKELTDIAEDLMDPTSNQYPAEWGQGLVASILDSLPNETQHLVLHHKDFIINPQLQMQSKKNICVQVTCLGPSDIPLNNYGRCHVQGGQVQTWTTNYSNQLGKVLNTLNKETFAAISAYLASSSDNEDDILLSQLSQTQKKRKS